MKIGIVSLGLIGGSLFKCLSSGLNEICAVTRNSETIKKAQEYSSNVSDNMENLKDCDVIFIASPINKTLEIMDELEDILPESTIVLDCASVKEFVMQKKRKYKFIGSHPMAGTEFNGFDASFKELFAGAKWVLTPSENIDEDDLKKVKEIIEQTGAQIIIADAKEHDEAVALISHMPMLVSQAVFETARRNPLALKLASSGFRDMTRLSMSNPEMARDMLNYNGFNIDKSVEMLNNSIQYLKDAKYFEKCADIKNIRSIMYSDEGKNLF